MDKDTQLKPSTIKNWNANPGDTMLPRATSCKRLRRQRETAERHARVAMGFADASGPYMPATMRAACPEMMTVFERIATGPAFPAAEADDRVAEAGAASPQRGAGSVDEPFAGQSEEEEYYNEACVPYICDTSGHGARGARRLVA